MTYTARLTKAGVLASAVVLYAGTGALAEIRPGDRIGQSVSEIARSLEDNGYEIREIEVKSNLIEADVTLAGNKLEIKVDPRTGLVSRVDND